MESPTRTTLEAAARDDDLLSTDSGSQRPARQRLATAGVLLAGTIGLSVLFYFSSVHAFSANSDSATALLEGNSIRHGNITLSGWSLSLDSFWSIDALFYAVAIAVGGIRASLFYLVPAVLAALTIVVGTGFITRGQHGRQRLVAAAIVLALLALPSHALAYFLLQGPWHVGTTLYCLIAMTLLSRGGFAWRWFVAVAFLAAGLLGDLQALAIGVVPIFCAGLVAAIRCRSLRAAAPTVLAAPAAIVLAAAGRLLASAVGTFSVTESHHTVSVHQLTANASNFVNWLSALVGLHQGVFGGPTVSGWLEGPHLLVAIALTLATVIATVTMFSGMIEGRGLAANPEQWRTDDLLVLGLLASVAEFAFLTLTSNPKYARYLDPVVIFGALLTARVLARLSLRATRPVRAATAILALVTVASSAATLAIDLSAATPAPPTAALERFLVAHGLRDGIGDYWAASVVSVDTRGDVQIRPVVANPAGILVADGRSALSTWYRSQRFSFLVYQRAPYGRVEPQTIARTFGLPAHTYHLGSYSVDVWPHPLTLGGEKFPA